MNIVTELLRLGAREFVAVLAEQSVHEKAGLREKSGRSAMSKAISAIRKKYSALTQGQKGYEAARNIFRMQERRAQNAFRVMQNRKTGSDLGLDLPPPRPRPQIRANNIYTLRVQTLSGGGAREKWTIVRVTAPAGATLAELTALASRAVEDLVDANTGSGMQVGGLGVRRRIGAVEWIG